MIFKQAYIPWLMYKIVCLLSFEDRGWAEWILSFRFCWTKLLWFFSKQLDVYLDEKYDQLFLRFGTYPTWPWKPSPSQTRTFWHKIEDFQFVVSILWLWSPSNWNGKEKINFWKPQHYSLISMRLIYYFDTWAIIWHDIVPLFMKICTDLRAKLFLLLFTNNFRRANVQILINPETIWCRMMA